MKNSNHLICFDLDGVLISSMQTANQIFYDVVDLMLGLPTEEYRKQKKTMAMSAEERFSFLWSHEIAERGITPEQITAALKEYRKQKMEAGIPLLPHAEEAVKKMAEHFEFLAVVSSNPDYMIEETLQRLGIRDYFSKITGLDHVQFAKPHPQMYALTADFFGIPHARALAFEDSTPGTESAKGAGLKVINVATGLESVEDLKKASADLILNDFSELDIDVVNDLFRCL